MIQSQETPKAYCRSILRNVMDSKYTNIGSGIGSRFSVCAAALLPNTPGRLWGTLSLLQVINKASRQNEGQGKRHVKGSISFSGRMETAYEIHRLLLLIHAEGLVASRMGFKAVI